jgi:hypothetical protein
MARERGRRHAINETNNSAVINANHHDPKTSKAPIALKNEPKNG